MVLFQSSIGCGWNVVNGLEETSGERLKRYQEPSALDPAYKLYLDLRQRISMVSVLCKGGDTYDKHLYLSIGHVDLTIKPQ